MSILWYIYGAYRLIGGILGMFFLHVASMRHFYGWNYGGWNHGGWNHGGPFSHGPLSYGPNWMAGLIPFVAFYTILAAALALFVGFSLANRRPWGRTLAIVAAILALFKPVLGTGLGIYTLWVLAPTRSGMEFDAIADRS